MLLGVLLFNRFVPPLRARLNLKSEGSRSPEPAFVEKTGSLNVIVIVVLSAASEYAVEYGRSVRMLKVCRYPKDDPSECATRYTSLLFILIKEL